MELESVVVHLSRARGCRWPSTIAGRAGSGPRPVNQMAIRYLRPHRGMRYAALALPARRAGQSVTYDERPPNGGYRGAERRGNDHHCGHRGNTVAPRAPRVEDPRLLAGRGRFVSDIALPGDGPPDRVPPVEPHAHLRRVDAAPARSAPGRARRPGRR